MRRSCRSPSSRAKAAGGLSAVVEDIEHWPIETVDQLLPKTWLVFKIYRRSTSCSSRVLQTHCRSVINCPTPATPTSSSTDYTCKSSTHYTDTAVKFVVNESISEVKHATHELHLNSDPGWLQVDRQASRGGQGLDILAARASSLRQSMCTARLPDHTSSIGRLLCCPRLWAADTYLQYLDVATQQKIVGILLKLGLFSKAVSVCMQALTLLPLEITYTIIRLLPDILHEMSEMLSKLQHPDSLLEFFRHSIGYPITGLPTLFSASACTCSLFHRPKRTFIATTTKQLHWPFIKSAVFGYIISGLDWA